VTLPHHIIYKFTLFPRFYYRITLTRSQVNISKVQDDEVGDGTTSVCVLAAELLREGERLVGQKIHPQTIIQGYRKASQAAYEALEASATDHRYGRC
jgi:chaperonin GroEL (HSP60 family)